MSGPRVGPLPLAFALAMAADVSAAGALNVPEGENLWRVGSLSRVTWLISARSNSSAEGRAAATEQMAQWLNFRNCFTGSWRNC